MKWFSSEDFAAKLLRLKSEITKYDEVILVGESAGATMVLHIAEENPRNVIRYATLCGVCSQVIPIHPRLKLRSPAFEKATRSLNGSYHLEKLHHFRAWHDPVVTKKYSSVEGAKVTTIVSVGHFFTIFLCLSVYAPWFMYKLRKTRLDFLAR